MESEAVEDARRNLGERAQHAIYGSIIVLAIIVAEDAAGVTVGFAIGSVLGAALVTGLAQVYSDYIGSVIRRRRHPTPAEWRDSAKNVAIGFLLASVPVVFFVLAALDVFTRQTAYDVAEWSGVAVLGAYAVFANRVAGFSTGRSLLVGGAFTALGALLVMLKVVL